MYLVQITGEGIRDPCYADAHHRMRLVVDNGACVWVNLHNSLWKNTDIEPIIVRVRGIPSLMRQEMPMNSITVYSTKYTITQCTHVQ